MDSIPLVVLTGQVRHVGSLAQPVDAMAHGADLRLDTPRLQVARRFGRKGPAQEEQQGGGPAGKAPG